MSKVDSSFPHDLYRFLVKSLRDTDEAGILERLVLGPQGAWEDLWARIETLDSLHDVDAIDDDLLPYLKHHVGWTNELDHITRDLTPTELRKLIRLSVAFWKTRGTEKGIKDAIRLFTGRDVVIWNWFTLRAVVDVTGLWHAGVGGIDPWLVGDTYGDEDEYLSIIWVMNEGDPPRELIHDLVQLHRPMGEAIRVNYAGLVDDFGLGVQKWTPVGGTPQQVWNEEDRRMTLPATSLVKANVDGLDTWDEFTLLGSFRLGDLAQAFQVAFRWDGSSLASADAYVVVVDNSAPSITLRRLDAGVASTLATASITALPVDPVACVVHCIRETVAELRIVVLLDGVEVIDYTEAPAGELPPGGIALYSGASYALEVDNVIAWEHPMYFDLVAFGQDDALPE